MKSEGWEINPGTTEHDPEFTGAPWEDYGWMEWALMVDGQPPELVEFYRSVMPPEIEALLFADADGEEPVS